MNYRFSDLVEINYLEKAIEKFHSLINLPIAVIDAKNQLLAGIGFTEICEAFHSKNHLTDIRCRKSITYSASLIGNGEFATITCPNGLINMVSPIIIDGKHIATFVIGQLLFEEPDIKFFENQALRLGFPLVPYMDALKKVPITPKIEAQQAMIFCADFAKLLAQLGLTTLKEKEDKKRLKAAKKHLEESEKKYQLLMNGITDIIIFCEVRQNSKLEILKVNKSFLDINGFTEKDVLGKCVQDVIPSELLCWNENTRAVLQNGEVRHFEGYFHGKQYDIKLIPVVNKGNHCTHVIISASDNSHKKTMEKVARLESVGLLAGGIAHDFNNILAVTLGNISLAKMKYNLSANNNILKYLEEAEKSLHQSKNLTDQLLTFSKGGSPVLKTALIQELLEEWATFALRGSNVNCEYIVEEDLLPVEVDEGQIRQVINNIVINARQAMPNGGTIKLAAENIIVNGGNRIPDLKDGTYVRISIKDHGTGIPLDILHKIFDPYFTTKKTGSGLGLTTSHSIINKHGGCIGVDSQVGVGTTFSIYLKASTQKGLVNNRSQKKTPLRVKGRVLVMDDQEMVRNILCETLQSFGVETVSAKDGDEAIQIFKQSNAAFNIVILDLTVPGGKGGKEIIQVFKEVNSNVKAIATSGYNDSPVMANYKEYGFHNVITKPFSREEIEEVLRDELIHL